MYRKRYVASAISIFVIGVAFGIFFDEYNTILRNIFIAVALLSVSAILLVNNKKDYKFVKIIMAVAGAIAVFSFGVMLISVKASIFNSYAVYDGLKETVVFESVEVNENSIDAKVVQSESGELKGKIVRVYLEDMRDGLVAGDRFKADVKYNYRKTQWNRSGDIVLSASGFAIEYYGGDGIFYKIRKYISVNCDLLFDDFKYASDISKAVIVGDRSDMDSRIFTIYKTAGISHILAISGLHISIITVGLFRLLSMFRIGRNVSSIIAAIISVFYAALVGFSPGVVRSAFMMSFMLVLGVCFRNADKFTTLFLALLLLLITNPYSICAPGLQLSFLCTLGIILFSPLINKTSYLFSSKLRRSSGLMFLVYKFVPSALTSMVIAIAASILSFPVLYSGFDTVSYVSPIANIVAVPLFSYGVTLSFVALLLSLVCKPLALVVAYPAGFLFDVVTEFAKLFFDMDIGITSVRTPIMILPLLLSFVFVGIMLFNPQANYKRYVGYVVVFSIALMAVTGFNGSSYKNQAVLEYSKNGSEYIYVSCENKNVYIDIGGYTSNPSTVFENGLTALNTYVLMDYNSNSMQRMEYFLSNVKVQTLALPNTESSYDVYFLSKIKELANEQKCDILLYNEVYRQDFSKDYRVEILRQDEFQKGDLFYVEILGNKSCFLGKGFDNVVICDIAIAMHGCESDMEQINAKDVYCIKRNSNDAIDNGISQNGFNESIKIKMNISKKDYKVYES